MTKKHLTAIILVGILFIIGATIYSSLFSVEADEEAVITRFGKYNRTALRGLRFKLPYVEQAYKVKVTKDYNLEFGLKTVRADVRSQISRSETDIRESRMLTADLNIIQIDWRVHYRIRNSKDFLFNVRNQEKTIRDISIMAMSQVIGDYLFDEVITIEKTGIANSVRLLVQESADKHGLGIEVREIKLNNVVPPNEVSDAYNEVVRASKEREKIVNDAKAEYNQKVIPVKGEADKLISQANGYYAERVNAAKGDVQYFNQLYAEYSRAPEVTKKRMYLETMSEILPALEEIYIVDENQKNIIPFLQMGKNNIAQ